MTQCDAPFVHFRVTTKEITDPPLEKYIAHQLSMDICHAFLKTNLLHGKYRYYIQTAMHYNYRSRVSGCCTNTGWRRRCFRTFDILN